LERSVIAAGCCPDWEMSVISASRRPDREMGVIAAGCCPDWEMIVIAASCRLDWEISVIAAGRCPDWERSVMPPSAAADMRGRLDLGSTKLSRSSVFPANVSGPCWRLIAMRVRSITVGTW
jgi:hypothetical protein